MAKRWKGKPHYVDTHLNTCQDPCILPSDGRCLIHRLPTELLVQTFLLGLTDVFQALEDTLDFGHNAPNVLGQRMPFEILVSHVCHRWRAVALNAPMLWTEIELSRPPLHNRAETCLERSKTSPLNIVADISAFNFDPQHTGWYCMRKSVRAKMCNVLPFGGDAPKLTHVNLSGVHIDWSRSRFLSGLTTLELSKHRPDTLPTFQEMARMLRESPNLHSLTLMESGPAGGTDEWDAELADSDSLNRAMLWSVSLSEVTLIFNEPDYLTDLVTGFVFPNLKTLHLGIKRPESDCTRLLESLAHPAPHTEKSVLAGLEELDIVRMPGGSADAVRAVYNAMPKLSALNISTADASAHWHTLLLCEEVLPRLTKLVIGGLTGAQMRNLVAKRQERGAPLWELIVLTSPEMTWEDMQWLRMNTHMLQWKANLTMMTPEIATIEMEVASIVPMVALDPYEFTLKDFDTRSMLYREYILVPCAVPRRHTRDRQRRSEEVYQWV
ncbi:hypothetical protein POSPLADRAFT_1035374 [Postia placenta MAD-698-R-SB12]|uniref:Uncharacterized protein n=1 Tax=Postia placenta MAD-698-R-SB12 TaxID=670580 RepID=A0A1X6MTY6_9APHY|nr:hypothetical protein POSPLADRAFT_1035374 [Postia placenta MAD-698-R-SB12]OSX59851.1 hypothetical protein POSPLADRAFT_1035374 [Postia placenta MAD-698-R-SB12]